MIQNTVHFKLGIADMNDYQVLGLEQDCSYAELKKAYREKSRLCHPDLNSDHLDSHLAMIRVNRAYANIASEIVEKPAVRAQVKEDEDYAVYRKGITKFQAIHPSRWKKYSVNGLFDPGAVATHSETPSVIQALITDLAEAYYCFSTVVNEYPDSQWYEDSLKKIKEIEKMTIRYVRIKESYEKELKSHQG